MPAVDRQTSELCCRKNESSWSNEVSGNQQQRNSIGYIEDEEDAMSNPDQSAGVYTSHCIVATEQTLVPLETV